MKPYFKPLLLSLFLTTSSICNAQSIFVVRRFDNNINKEAKVCPTEREAFTQASDEMFEARNPNYIIVDLIKDGYLNINDSFEYNISIKLSEPPIKGAKYVLDIPAKKQTEYIYKFERFLKATGMTKKRFEDHTGSISFTNTITQKDITDPKSEFRTGLSTITLKHLRYYYHKDRGNLRLYQELAKDGLAPLDKALELDFSEKGFYVHGKRLNRTQREKYATLCKEEFDNDYYTDKSSIKIGALPENTLAKRIAALKEKIANNK